MNIDPEALALRRETEIKKIKVARIRAGKAWSQVMRYRVGGECFFRVTRKGLLEAVTFPEIQTDRSAKAQGQERAGLSEQQEGGQGWQQREVNCLPRSAGPGHADPEETETA